MSDTKPVALVTGASSGIGAAAATALATAGFVVVGTSRSPSQLDDRDGVTFVDLDVADDESVARAIERVIERFGRLDVVVNNAGSGAIGAAEETSLDELQRIFDVNFFGAVRVTTAALAHMRANGGGRIINISSVLGFVPAPFMASYAAAKHAVEGYSESVDHEVRQYGVRVLLVEPGYTRTTFEANASHPDDPLPVYSTQRQAIERLNADAIRDGEDPAVVARAIVAAATDHKPKLRYAAGAMARKVRRARRLAPAGAFDRQIRKLNHLPT